MKSARLSTQEKRTYSYRQVLVVGIRPLIRRKFSYIIQFLRILSIIVGPES